MICNIHILYVYIISPYKCNPYMIFVYYMIHVKCRLKQENELLRHDQPPKLREEEQLEQEEHEEVEEEGECNMHWSRQQTCKAHALLEEEAVAVEEEEEEEEEEKEEEAKEWLRHARRRRLLLRARLANLTDSGRPLDRMELRSEKHRLMTHI